MISYQKRLQVYEDELTAAGAEVAAGADEEAGALPLELELP